jgi:hypothetical protein
MTTSIDNDDKATGQTLINAEKEFVISFANGLKDVRFFIDGQPVALTTTFDMSNCHRDAECAAQLPAGEDRQRGDRRLDAAELRDRPPRRQPVGRPHRSPEGLAASAGPAARFGGPLFPFSDLSFPGEFSMPKTTTAAGAAAQLTEEQKAAAERRAAYDAQFTPDDQRGYALAVVAKQAGVSLEEAAKLAEQLGADKLTELHDAGREGRVADCRALLGLN